MAGRNKCHSEEMQGGTSVNIKNKIRIDIP
jgi:hypothetical protein